jgi:AhpD family alkylhydroperoxidase
MQDYRKRYYTPRTFLRDLGEILASASDFRRTARSGRISRAFAEKIMMAVTGVNDCRYCARFHAKLALKEGVPPDEIEQILAGEIGHFPEEEAVALAYAQHWAETGGSPDPVAERRFRNYYGPEVSADIVNYVRMISFGNLSGNMFDAILWRLGFRLEGA